MSHIRKPTLEELRRAAEAHFLRVTEEELAAYRALMDEAIASYRRLDQFPEPKLPVHYPRTPGYRPGPEENPLNAWYWKCSITGAPAGKLAGKKVAVKDNVCVAGIPMMNGTAILEGYVPDVDATIVTRILDAAGEIAGKAVCESLCLSCSSHTADTGPTHNPHKRGYSAGGSSSGSAALLAAGEVDLAIGGDQGGSIRMPAAFCGVFGLKPTYGLVPYTGVFPIEITLDHTGPMARTAYDCALLLEVIAGPDGLDPRQPADLETEPYTARLSGDARGLTIGVVREGFAWPGLSEADIDSGVRDAAQRFGKAGATVREISIPLHRDAIHVWRPIAIEGTTQLMVRGNAMGTNWKGWYNTSLLDAYARGRQARATDLSESTKLTVLLGQFMQDYYHGRYYAKAQNLAPTLTAAYDAAFRACDLLVMPTTPMKATPLPGPDASREEIIRRALEVLVNTCPFDVTGHPAMNVPCGMSDGLPIGMMLVGRSRQDATVLRAAHAFEQLER
jgi:amidase